MPRFKSEPQPSWPAEGSSKPFPGTLLRNSRFHASTSDSTEVDPCSSSVSFQVKSGLHPLGTLGEINDIQRCITEAILVHGQPCPQDYILDFVAARWRSLNTVGGNVKQTDPRRATLEQLYSDASSSRALFEPCKSKQSRWRLATSSMSASSVTRAPPSSGEGGSHFSRGGSGGSYSGAPYASSSSSPHPFASSSTSGHHPQHYVSSRHSSSMAIDDSMSEDSVSDQSSSTATARRGSSNSPSNVNGRDRDVPVRITRRRTKRKRVGDDGTEEPSSEDEMPTLLPGGRDAAYLLNLPRKKPKVYTLEELSYDASAIPPEELLERVKESKLTDLQILISISIIRSPNYEARLDYILEFVSQHYTYLLGRDGNPKATDPKRAVLASLSKNASSSPLFVKVGDVWKIGPKNVLFGAKEVIPGLMEYITVSKAPGDAVELTELQKMIMRAISLEGGTCGLEKIYEYVKPRYDRLKRRDGSSYATNARRAIQASLSNNSSNRPIFMLAGTRDEETLWSLTERGQESLEMISMSDQDVQSYDNDDSSKDEGSAHSTSNTSVTTLATSSYSASGTEAASSDSATTPIASDTSSSNLQGASNAGSAAHAASAGVAEMREAVAPISNAGMMLTTAFTNPHGGLGQVPPLHLDPSALATANRLALVPNQGRVSSGFPFSSVMPATPSSFLASTTPGSITSATPLGSAMTAETVGFHPFQTFHFIPSVTCHLPNNGLIPATNGMNMVPVKLDSGSLSPSSITSSTETGNSDSEEEPSKPHQQVPASSSGMSSSIPFSATAPTSTASTAAMDVTERAPAAF